MKRLFFNQFSKTIVYLISLLIIISPIANALEINELLSSLIKTKESKADFVEKWFVSLLDEPVESSGSLRFDPPDTLEMRKTSPKPEILILSGNQITFERDNKKHTIQIGNRPEARAFIESIRSLFVGDQITLKKNYKLTLQGDNKAWKLTLEPKEVEVLAIVKNIVLSGNHNNIGLIEYFKPDGDHMEMTIEVIEHNKPIEPAQYLDRIEYFEKAQ